MISPADINLALANDACLARCAYLACQGMLEMGPDREDVRALTILLETLVERLDERCGQASEIAAKPGA